MTGYDLERAANIIARGLSDIGVGLKAVAAALEKKQ